MAGGRSTKWLYVAAVAVLVPAGILAVLQYRVLVSLESETQIAVRESSRQTIRAYDDAIDDWIDEMSRAALGQLASVRYGDDGPDRLLSELRDALNKQEFIDQVSMAQLCDCPEAFAAVVSKDQIWMQTGDSAGEWPLRRYLARARPSLSPEKEGRVAFLHIEIEREPDFAGLYAFKRFGEVVASIRLPREVLLRIVGEVARRERKPGEEAMGAPEFHLVHETSGAPINTESPRSGYELREALGEPLTGWALAAYYRGRSVSAMSRESLQYNLITMAAVLATLILGVVLSLSAVARQARLAEMKSTFVSNVSHEMRTPLALISLYSETLEMERFDDPEKIHEYHRTIHRESKRLAQMVNNVLDFSRIESGRREYRPARCSVQEIIDEVLAAYREPILAAGFELVVEIDNDLPPILADKNALSQAVLNLLDNAVKYSSDEKFIAVRASRSRGNIAISVEDHGLGIPPNEQSRIFQKFHRAGSPLTSATRGSGLGLALAKHAVEAHGGHIELESKVGQGSRFTILLPITKDPPESSIGGQVVAASLSD